MEATTQPLVSIITVNYNQAHVTRELLDSLQEISYKNFEVIIVDNASKENPAEVIGDSYPNVKFILSDKNLGFAGGNNLGIREAKGEYLFFVNNDTEFTIDLIEQSLAPFSKNSNIGMVCPKVRDYTQPKLLQYAGYTPINPYTARNATIGLFMEDNGQFDTPGPTAFPHGAAMMVKREVIENVGMMPEEFFLYYEEFDWCEQIKRAGYQLYFEPKAVIYHKESISVGKRSTLKTYYMTRNRIYFMRRNTKNYQFMVFSLFLLFVTLPKNIFQYIRNAEYNHIKAFMDAVCWNFKNKRML
jgi:GT2 family glycosyltransferase